MLRKTFAGAGWETDRVLAALEDVDDPYTESLGQVHAPRWSQGRLVLLGDAAFCPLPMTGMGTTLAIVGAYVLAGEIPQGAKNRQSHLACVAVLQPAIRVAGTPLAPGIARRLNRGGTSPSPFELHDYGPWNRHYGVS